MIRIHHAHDSSSLSAATQVGSKMKIGNGLLGLLVLWARILIQFPILMLRDYVLAPSDQNVFKKELTGQ